MKTIILLFTFSLSAFSFAETISVETCVSNLRANIGGATSKLQKACESDSSQEFQTCAIKLDSCMGGADSQKVEFCLDEKDNLDAQNCACALDANVGGATSEILLTCGSL